MHYTIVKQFLNNFIDNIFNFFFRIIDFSKVLVEVFWSFYEIWEAFFLIFFNLFMYIYYLFLFAIDRTSQSQSQILFWKKAPKIAAYKPQSAYAKETSNPVSGMYGSTSSVSAVKTAAVKVDSLKSSITQTTKKIGASSPTTGAKVPIFRRIIEAISSFFETLRDFIFKPFISIAEVISLKLKPVKEDNEAPKKKKSLIDEYMKEFSQKRSK